MHKHNANNQDLAVCIIKNAATPFAFSPLTAWFELMPQTVNNRRDVSRYGACRWKLLPTLKENS